jgi:general secretion pathway protein E
MDDELRAELLQRRGSGDLRQIAINKGMRTLQGDGLRLVRLGITTLEEVMRVTRA